MAEAELMVIVIGKEGKVEEKGRDGRSQGGGGYTSSQLVRCTILPSFLSAFTQKVLIKSTIPN